VLFISAPFILDVLFLWNNTEVTEGLKHAEKRLSLMLFPIIIIFQRNPFDLLKVLRIYAVCFTLIMTVLFIRYTIVDSTLLLKYMNGKDLWEVGYSFATSINLHAPAVNMHVAFLVMVHTYLLSKSIITTKSIDLIGNFILLALSIFHLLFLNTRIAVIIAIAGILFIVAIEATRILNRRKVLIITGSTLLVLTFVVFAFAKANTYMIQKYTDNTFKNMEMVGRLDEFDDPEGEIFSSLVTRVSIWETALKRSQQDIWIGVGAADGKDELNQAYIDTNQVFLAKYKFPTHNQYIDFLLKFGVLGLCATTAYMLHILWISYRLKSSLIFMFFILFFTANLTDDFLIRFDGITFSALWISLFVGYYWRGHPDINRQGL
jgi:O-antigen ligase